MYKKIVEKTDQKMFGKRCDDNHLFFYYSASDFKGLLDDKYEFKIEDGTTLRGHFYYYPNFDPKKLIIFCHGFSAGHRSYFPEIEYLCKAGLKVLAFDYKGTFESDGENLTGFSEPIEDLYSLLNTLTKEGYFDKYEISLIGHSWGGFAIGNILNYFDNISKAIVISGPTSLADYLDGYLPKYIPFRKRLILETLEKEATIYPKFYSSTSISAYLKTKTKVLLIQSIDDKVVNFNFSSGKVQRTIGKKKNIEYYFIKDHVHNPTYSKDAVIYFNSVIDKYNDLLKHHKLKTFEEKQAYFKDVKWKDMTKLDKNVMNKITTFIKQ
jgi:dipeptidyl aminopeptidase/acylaminoacyl peptidase